MKPLPFILLFLCALPCAAQDRLHTYCEAIAHSAQGAADARDGGVPLDVLTDELAGANDDASNDMRLAAIAVYTLPDARTSNSFELAAGAYRWCLKRHAGDNWTAAATP